MYFSFDEIDLTSINLAPSVFHWWTLKEHDRFKLTLLTPMSNQDRISPYNINQISDKNKEKYQFGDN